MSIITQHRRGTRAQAEANTPADGEFWWDQTLKAVRAGDGATLGGFLLKRWRYFFPLSPAQITSAIVNDYSPTDLAIGENIFLNSNQLCGLTGLAGGGAGARVTLINRGSFDISLYIENALSTAANRFSFESDIILRPKSSVSLQYSVTDSRWMRADGGTKFSRVPQELIMEGVITPAQIAANQNDYAPSQGGNTFALVSIVRLSSDASRNITGMVDVRDGVEKVLLNIGTNPIVLKNADAGSTAANRFDFGTDVTLAAKQSAVIRYDATDSRWKLVASTAGSGVAAGAVTAQTLAASSLGAFVGMVNGTFVPSVAGSALTIALKTLAGADPTAADPVFVVFRNPTAATGDYAVLTVTAATSLVISSGSSLGTTNSTAFKIWVVGFNDAGTFRLGAFNSVGGTNVSPLAAWGIASSTAEGGAGGADSAQTFYTGTAVTSKAYIPLAYMTWETGLGAAGTWSAGPTRTQLFGPGVPLPGHAYLLGRSDSNSVATGTTQIPHDNTIPQITEGDQYMSLAVTPSSAAHLLRVKAQLFLANTGAALTVMNCALFQDATANALKACVQRQGGANFFHAPAELSHVQLAGLSASTTFRVRAGSNAAVTTSFNGEAGAGFYGGTLNSFLEVEEIVT